MSRKKANEILLRFIVLAIGLFIMALGVALSTKADLGVSPISCLPYVLSLILPFTMGQLTSVMLAIFLLFQIIILRREFQWVQLNQLAVALIYGEMTDLTLWMIRGMEVSNYIVRWILCILSACLVAIGVAVEVCADVSSLAGDGLMKIIAQKTRVEFGKIKIMFDCGFTISGSLIGLIAFHKLTGVREGTIAAAILVGMIVSLIYRIPFVRHFLPVRIKPWQGAGNEADRE